MRRRLDHVECVREAREWTAVSFRLMEDATVNNDQVACIKDTFQYMPSVCKEQGETRTRLARLEHVLAIRVRRHLGGRDQLLEACAALRKAHEALRDGRHLVRSGEKVQRAVLGRAFLQREPESQGARWVRVLINQGNTGVQHEL